MATPVLHLVAGPNGAGKTTFYERVLAVTHLPFVNADRIARERWPEDPDAHAYEAAAIAEERRRRAMEKGRSFIAETVFSHPSKLELVQAARAAGYRTTLHVVLIPEELAVRRVEARVDAGGHPVPEEKIRQPYRRLWPLVRQALQQVDEAQVLDNTRSRTPFRRVALFDRGRLVGDAAWPAWTPPELRALEG